MRLVGASFEGRSNRLTDSDFAAVLREAVALLRGEGLTPDDSDDRRERVLADDERKLGLLAVGDDDQNIYAFAEASVEFIRRFEEDYKARPLYLTANYRSSRHIIEAANAVIERSSERMKEEHPIRVNRAHSKEPWGGEWSMQDPVGQGRVQILTAGETPIMQAQVVMAELQRLANQATHWSWSNCGVIAREWRYLNQIRSLCELEGIPVQMANEDVSSTWLLRETQSLLKWLQERDTASVRYNDIAEWLSSQRSNEWTELIGQAAAEFELEVGDRDAPVDHFREWLAE